MSNDNLIKIIKFIKSKLYNRIIVFLLKYIQIHIHIQIKIIII